MKEYFIVLALLGVLSLVLVGGVANADATNSTSSNIPNIETVDYTDTGTVTDTSTSTNTSSSSNTQTVNVSNWAQFWADLSAEDKIELLRVVLSDMFG